MKFQLISIIAFVVLFNAQALLAQDEAYKGGIGDGFSFDSLQVSYLEATKGSPGDGYSFTSSNNFFIKFSVGGHSDGHSKVEVQNTFFDFTRGGISDGFSSNTFDDDSKLTYMGGISDGFSTTQILNDNSLSFTGGESDGFAYDKYGHVIYWTGIVGTGWNVPGNWENGLIPSYCNPVVIPSGAPNFPAVNSGVLRIGYYKDEGDYRCHRLKINSNAEMTTRVNCFVENYNLIFNRGKLFVKNQQEGAFKNLGEGIIQIKPNAEIIFKE